MMIVRDFMQKIFICLSPQCTVKSAAEEMIRKGVDTLFVTENDEVVGVIGIRDLFTLPIPASFGGPMKIIEEGNLIRGWENTHVEQLMNPHVVSIPENYPLMDAAMRMINEGKHPLAILHEKKMIGIIDRSDIVKALLKMEVSA